MDNETIARLGFEAGAESVGFFTLKKFAELIAAHEREALLDLVDNYAKNNTDLKAAIRARK
jgi:hypothetical protein